MNKIIIIGGVGTSLNIAQHIIDSIQKQAVNIELLGFSVDDDQLGNEILNYPVLCKPKEIIEKYYHSDVKVIFALYRPDVIRDRTKLLESYNIPLEKFTNFIHHSVFYSNNLNIGTGNVVLSNSCLMNNVAIGNFNIINSNVTIEHDSVIKNNNFIAANVCIGSKVTINNYNFIGLNSTIKEQTIIDEDIVIGMGSNVLKNLNIKGIYFGNPAKLK